MTGLLPSDFRVKTVDGVAEDWPISYNDLKPYHDEVDAFIGVAGVDGDPAYPAGLAYPRPPHPIGKAGVKAATAANKLGWHWWPGTNAIASQKFKTLDQCGRWGTCEWGCPQGAKASFDLVYLAQAIQMGADVVTGARVRRIVTDTRGLATGAEYIDRAGTVRFQAARAVVVCANGIGTPRQIRRARSRRWRCASARSSSRTSPKRRSCHECIPGNVGTTPAFSSTPPHHTTQAVDRFGTGDTPARR